MKIVVLAALSLLAFAGCNTGQPRLYRVAVDMTPIRTIAVPSCFRNNNLPAGRGNITEQNYRSEDEWVIWTGVQQTEYLDLGTQTFNLGDAPTIRVNDLIEGTDKSFAALRNEQKPIATDYTEARQTQIAVKFDDYSFSPVGTINLNAQYACIRGMTDCPTGNASPPDAASCTSQVNFVARRIDAQQLTVYNNNPQ
ncbi:MAG: hypothetical protein U0228_18930 [Myxococcaceae bacterium]